MKAKKLLTALLVSAFAVTLTLGITACGDKKEPSDPMEYDVTYSAGIGTGTAVKKGSYAADATFTVAAADEFNFTYTNDGTDYYIAKWNDGAKDVEIGSTYTMPAHNVTLTAQWKANIDERPIHYVTYYDYDRTTVIHEEEVREGDASTYIAAPTTGYSEYSQFIEWDKSEAGLASVTQDYSVYGKWKYEQSDEALFDFTTIDDGAAYTVAAKAAAAADAEDQQGGGTVYLPITYNKKPVLGITAGTNSETAAFGTLNAETVVIPDTYDVIAAYAFADNETITKIAIGATGSARAEGKKLDIADHAFYYMTNLATFNSETEGTVHIPASTTQIGDYAFAFNGSVSKAARNGSPVTAITFAEHSALTSIGEQAFAYTGAKALVVPASLQTIGKQAFYCAKELASFSAEAGSVLTTIGEQAFIGGTAKNLLGALSTITIPGSVTEIGTKAFYENTISSLTFEAGTADLSIGESAFAVAIAAEKPSATSLTIPDRTVSIGKEAFKFWGSATTLTFPTAAKFTTIGEGAFYGFSALEALTLPAGIQTIGKNAFYQIGAIGTLVIPDGVTTIGEGAFYNASAITSVTIPTSVTSIEKQAFYGTHNLGTVTFTAGGMEGLTIGEQAFGASSYIGSSKADDKLTSFEFPARTTSIGKAVFYQRQLLKTVTFAAPAEGEPTLDLTFAELALSSFNATSSTSMSTSKAYKPLLIESLTIPARTTSIGNYAFAGLPELKTLVFEEGIKTTAIPDYAAYFCCKIQTLTIPEGIKTIGKYAIGLGNKADNSSQDKAPSYKVTQLTAKDGGYTAADITVENAFNTAMTTLTIPSTVESIGMYALMNLTALKTLRFEDIKEDAASQDAKMEIAMYNFAINGGLPAEIQEAIPEIDVYIGSSVKSFANSFGYRMKLKSLTFSNKSGLETTGSDMFGLCTEPTITTVELPASLTTIGANAFTGLSSLTSYTVASGNTKFEAESGVLYQKAEGDGQRTLLRYPANKAETTFDLANVIVGDNAFAGNAKIVTLNVGQNVTLGNAAFRVATALTTLNINSQPTYADGASRFFAECPNLATVTLADGVTKLGPEMFRMSSAPGGNDVATQAAQTELTTINGLDHVTEYADYAFYHCDKLQFGDNFKIADGVTTLPAYVFGICNQLNKIDLNGVTTIADNAFFRTGITTIDISKVTSLGKNAFTHSKLQEITIPDAITSLDTTFNNCADLMLIKIPRTTGVTTIDINSALFTGTKYLTAGTAARVVVPDDLVDDYRTDATWSKKAAIPEHIVGTTEYTITFAKADDLKGAASATIPQEAAKDYKFATYKLPAADEKGIDEGYYLAWIIGEEEYLPGATITLDGAETSLTATLTAVKYATVTFSWGEGVTDASGDPPKSITVKHGTIADPGVLPSRPGYAFVGWKKQGAEGLWNFETDVVNGDITLEVVWGKEIDVTFSWGDGVTDVTGELPEATKGYQGLVVADPDVTPTREDYVFKGWKKSDAEDTELWNFDEDTIPLDAESIQFVAVWEATPTD